MARGVVRAAPGVARRRARDRHRESGVHPRRCPAGRRVSSLPAQSRRSVGRVPQQLRRARVRCSGRAPDRVGRVVGRQHRHVVPDGAAADGLDRRDVPARRRGGMAAGHRVPGQPRPCRRHDRLRRDATRARVARPWRLVGVGLVRGAPVARRSAPPRRRSRGRRPGCRRDRPHRWRRFGEPQTPCSRARVPHARAGDHHRVRARRRGAVGGGRAVAGARDARRRWFVAGGGLVGRVHRRFGRRCPPAQPAVGARLDVGRHGRGAAGRLDRSRSGRDRLPRAQRRTLRDPRRRDLPPARRGGGDRPCLALHLERSGSGVGHRIRLADGARRTRHPRHRAPVHFDARGADRTRSGARRGLDRRRLRVRRARPRLRLASAVGDLRQHRDRRRRDPGGDLDRQRCVAHPPHAAAPPARRAVARIAHHRRLPGALRRRSTGAPGAVDASTPPASPTPSPTRARSTSPIASPSPARAPTMRSYGRSR